MLTAGEIQAIETALNDLERTVIAAEEAADDARNWLAFVGIEDDLTRQARERAEVIRNLWRALRLKRDALAELAGPDHEGAIEIVAMAKKHAGRDVAGEIRQLVEINSPVGMAGEVAKKTARDAADAAKSAAGFTVWGVLPLVGLALVAFVVWQLAPFFKGSR